MPEDLVSIIIPVYNGSGYLEEAIESAIAQTWPNKEIIIIDDGSTDNSLDLAKKKESASVKVFSQTNKGASAARNKGIRESSGDYLQFLDADDKLKNDKIEKQVQRLAGKNDHIALGGTVHFQDGSDPAALPTDFGEFEIVDPVYFLQRLYGGAMIEAGHEGMIQPNAWLTPRRVIEAAGYWNEELTLDDDGEYFCRAVLASKGVIYIPDSVNYYRKFKTGQSLSGSKHYAAMKSALRSNELKYQHLKKKDDGKLTGIALAKLFTEFAVKAYPQYPNLTRAAEERLEQLPPIDYLPILGGSNIEFIKKKFGWKVARKLSYYLKKLD